MTAIISDTAALIAGALGFAAVLERQRSLARWMYLAGMSALAIESFLGGLSLDAAQPETAAQWERARVFAASFLPFSWLFFSLTYSRGDAKEGLSRWRLLLIGLALMPLLGAFGLMDGLVTVQRSAVPNASWTLRLTSLGLGLSVVLLLTSVLVLANLEQTFRASVGMMRWRIKYMVLGLAALFAVRIYTTSQALLFTSVNPRLEPLKATALFVGCGLMGLSLLRGAFSGVDVYPSGSLLKSSITLLLCAVYLLVVGFLAKLVTLLGNYASFPLQALLVLLCLVGLSILLLSERTRQYPADS